jgi:hypothetical protein
LENEERMEEGGEGEREVKKRTKLPPITVFHIFGIVGANTNSRTVTTLLGREESFFWSRPEYSFAHRPVAWLKNHAT